MPRGVYDRSKNKSDVKTETAKASKKSKPATASSAPAKKGGSVAALPTADSGTQFAILRENISTLAHVRVELGNSDAARQVELELVQHITTLTKLRQDVFGKTEAEKIAQGTSSVVGNGTGPTIPLPTNPVNIPPPPSA